jgi:2-amino-4-hydroxy-6-hydroxymethyldihydropteridine diphosphokinase
MRMEPYHACLGLGANLGDRIATLRAAVAALRRTHGIVVEETARVYDTAPIGPEQPRYLNSAVRVSVSLEPLDLLDAILEIERAYGRDRSRETRFGPRTLDLDVLYIVGAELSHPRLTVPHPRLVDRAFALAPLLDVMPEAHATYAPLYARLCPLAPDEDLTLD